MYGLSRRARLLLGALAAFSLAACAPAQQAGPSPTGTASPPSTASPAASPASSATAPASPGQTSSPSPAPTIDGPSYANPVFARDFPDPHVLQVDGTYYAYSTAQGTAQVPVLRSSDLASWERVGDAMGLLPRWARPGRTWAPGVIDVADGFVLFFTAHHRDSDRQCIGVASAAEPTGPFLSEAAEPLVCQLDLGGSIDPYPFRDSQGDLYLYWKNDGNCCGHEVWLWGQRLSDDGLSLEGEPVTMLQRDQPWERPLIENPAMVEHEGTYFLFYSANRWEGPYYAVGYGVCESAVGPCEKPLDEPVFMAGSGVTGPGGQAFFHDPEGNLWMAYHAWTGIRVGYPRGERSLRIEPVYFEDGEPVIEGPTTDPQPMP